MPIILAFRKLNMEENQEVIVLSGIISVRPVLTA